MPGASEKNDDSSSRHVDRSYFADHDVHFYDSTGREIGGPSNRKAYLENGRPLPEGSYVIDEDNNRYEYDSEKQDYVFTGHYGADNTFYDSEGLNKDGKTEDGYVHDEETGEWIGPDGEPDPDYEPEQHGPSGEDDGSGDGDPEYEDNGKGEDDYN